MTLRPRSAALAFALLLAAPAPAGEVVTARQRLDGQVTLSGSGVRVGQTSVPWNEVIAVELDPAVNTYPAPATIVTRAGERWTADVVGLSSGSITIRSSVLGGRRQVPVSELAAIRFTGNAGLSSSVGTGVVVLNDAVDPLPAELLWIDQDELAVESLFGVMRLPRQRVAAYIFDSVSPAAAAGADVVELIDGTRLAGSVALSSQGVVLTHPQLGQIRLPEPVIRRLERSPEQVVRLAQLEPTEVQARPLLLSARPPMWSDGQLTLYPGNSMSFVLAQPGRTLRMSVAPLSRSAGPAKLRVLAGATAVLERTVAADAAPAWVEAELGGAQQITIEALYAEPVRLPAGVLLDQAHVLTR